MVNALRAKGISDARVLAAMNLVPRHFFLDSAIDWLAYTDDKAVKIAAGQTISRPFTVATQTQLLQVKPGEKVLEIGTGSGYQAAVLCALGVDLHSIERQKELHDGAQKILGIMGYRLELVFGDGFEGLPGQAPFDKIIITCGAGEMPWKLLNQLAVGGRMVIPMGSGAQLTMHVYERVDERNFREIKYGECAFVPMLKGVEN